MILQRKIYFTVMACIVFACMSCGKKVENSDPSAGKFVSRSPALNGSSIKLDTLFDKDGVIENGVFQFTEDAWLTIPEHMVVESGGAQSFTARLFFNTENDQTVEGATEFFCEYRASKQLSQGEKIFDGYYHQFVGCFEDIDGDGDFEEISYVPGDEMAQDKDHYIRLEYVTGSTESTTQASIDLEIQWF